MRITHHEDQISLRDRPAPYWALGLFLLAGGVLAVAMPLGLATNANDLMPWERLGTVAIGIGVSAGALWWLERSPGSHVHLDLTRRTLRLVRFGRKGREIQILAFDDLAAVEVQESTDSEGGAVWRPGRTFAERSNGLAVRAVEPRPRRLKGGGADRGGGLQPAHRRRCARLVRLGLPAARRV